MLEALSLLNRERGVKNYLFATSGMQLPHPDVYRAVALLALKRRHGITKLSSYECSIIKNAGQIHAELNATVDAKLQQPGLGLSRTQWNESGKRLRTVAVCKSLKTIIHMARMRALFHVSPGRGEEKQKTLHEILRQENMSRDTIRWLFCPVNKLEARLAGLKWAELTLAHSTDVRFRNLATQILRKTANRPERRTSIIPQERQRNKALPPPDHLPGHTVVYTDGAFARGRAGCGVHFPESPQYDTAYPLGTEDVHTSARAEIGAFIIALQVTPGDTPLQVITDSQMLIDGYSQHVGKEPLELDRVANSDMWLTVSTLTKGRRITLSKVTSHIGIPGNERADEIATWAISGEYDPGPGLPRLKVRIVFEDT